MKDFTEIHPRHMEEHIRSLAKANHLAAREATLMYLNQLYSKYLAEDKINGSPFDKDILNALQELEKKWKS